MNSFFVLFLLAFPVSFALELPFLNRRDGFGKAHVKALVGTPGQKVKLALSFSDKCPGISVYSSGKKHRKYGFNEKDSKTFHKTGKFDDGVYGTDDFVFKSLFGDTNQTLQQIPLTVVEKGHKCKEKPVLSLTYSTKSHKNQFLDAILADQEEKIVVLAYDYVPRDQISTFTGKLHLGDRANQSCASNWLKIPAIQGEKDSQWKFGLNKFEIGKFASFTPGQALFNVHSSDFSLSPETFNHVKDALGITGIKVPCNSTKDIIFTANGLDLHVTPEDYADKSLESEDLCIFNGYENEQSNQFTLPVGVLGRYCLMLDLKNKELGVAEKLQKSIV